MSLPPLPNRTILTPAKHTVWGYTLEQMQADRKQCREAVLEVAAQACEALACTDDGDSNTTRHECAAKIRSLKK